MKLRHEALLISYEYNCGVQASDISGGHRGVEAVEVATLYHIVSVAKVAQRT